jgi:hypothetical protein
MLLGYLVTQLNTSHFNLCFTTAWYYSLLTEEQDPLHPELDIYGPEEQPWDL